MTKKEAIKLYEMAKQMAGKDRKRRKKVSEFYTLLLDRVEKKEAA